MRVYIFLLFVTCLYSCSPDNISNEVGMNFVYIKSGTFMMGTPPEMSKEAREELKKLVEELSKYVLAFMPAENNISDEKEYQVTIEDNFYLQTTEVTQGQWYDVMGTKPWSGKKYVRDNRDDPAVYVSWNDVAEFIKKLNLKEDTNKYRLPTEAEWEFACRAGSTSIYNFDTNKNKLEEYAWFDKNTLNKGEHYGHKTGEKKPNLLGLYDMYGNVWEWCSDWYGKYPSFEKEEEKEKKINSKSRKYKNQKKPVKRLKPENDPTNPRSLNFKVFRGGGWDSVSLQCRSAIRNSYRPDYKDFSIGFRLAKSTSIFSF